MAVEGQKCSRPRPATRIPPTMSGPLYFATADSDHAMKSVRFTRLEYFDDQCTLSSARVDGPSLPTDLGGAYRNILFLALIVAKQTAVDLFNHSRR